LIKNILNTISIRVFNAFITLIIVIINSNAIGAEGMGTISLIILAISIFVLLTGFISGALIYFVPRENIFQLFVISYTWTFIMFILFFVLMCFVPIVPEKYILHVSILSFVFAGSNIHEKILTGKEKISTVNMIALIRLFFLLIPLLILYFFYSEKSASSYVYALFFSYLSGFIFSFFFVLKYLKEKNKSALFPVFKRVFKLGAYTALGNMVQKLNYRLSYYFIEYFLGINVLGQFSVAIQVSESTLIIGRSVAFVHYSKISNLKDRLTGIKITQSLIKMIIVIAGIIITVLSFIPSDIYTAVFSKDFSGSNLIILSLSVGIIFLSATMIISSYFAGTGKHYYNMKSSFAGFLVTLVLGLILIPKFTLIGAGITASLSYLCSFLYQFILFKKESETSLNDLFIKKEDVRLFKSVLFSIFSKPHKHNNPA